MSPTLGVEPSTTRQQSAFGRFEFVDSLLIPGRLPSRSMPLDVWMLGLVLVLTMVSLLYVKGLEELP